MEEGNKGSKPLVSQTVIILAENFNPSKAQWELLNRGLTFVPTFDSGKNQRTQLQLDIQNYHRRLKLAAYFGDKGKRKPIHFTPTSLWQPPQDKLPPEINFLIKII